MSRTKKSVKNILFNLLNVLTTLVLMFGVRTLFIQTLGVKYLGLNGVFQNIFQFLSLAELGIGSAISYRLYKPLNEDNERRIAALMTFFRKAYYVISLFIIGISILLLPFLDNIIGEGVENVNIYLVYLIYISQTLSSYLFFAYKMTLLKADQREYIISKYATYLIIASSLTEIFILYYFQSFIAYLLVIVGANILKNLLISLRVDKDYPYLHKYDEELDEEELKDMFKDFFASFLYRINSVVLNSTDNLILTYYLGLSIVGYYSNYLLITNNLVNFIKPILLSIKASLGSFIAQRSKAESYHLFQMINVLTIILYGGSAVGVFILSNRFITIWIGEEYILSLAFVLLLSIEFYFRGVQLFLSQIRNAMGLFQQLKYRPLASMIINFGGSLVLVQYFGIEGVLLGTILASILTNMIFDPLIIHKYGFNTKPIIYYSKNLYYFSLMLISGYISYYLTLTFPTTLIGLLLTFIVTFSVIIIVYGVGLFWMKEFRQLLKRIYIFIKENN